MTPTPGRPTPERVAAMFGRIAERYDLMNSLMTARLDESWRIATVQAVNPPLDGRALDVGTGTGHLAATLAQAMPGGCVVGVDLTLPMLRAGQEWLRGREEAGRIRLVALNPQPLPPKTTFDFVALNPQPLPPSGGTIDFVAVAAWPPG